MKESCAIKRRQINNVNSKRVTSLVCAALPRIFVVVVALLWFLASVFVILLPFINHNFHLLRIQELFYVNYGAQLEQQCQSVYCLSCRVPLKSVFVICYVIAACAIKSIVVVSFNRSRGSSSCGAKSSESNGRPDCASCQALISRAVSRMRHNELLSE